jgi:hypothetical protein
MNETEVKYLAGLIDADGSIGFEFIDSKVYLRLYLTAADSIDTKGYVYNLPTSTGFGSSCYKDRKEGWSKIAVWTVGSRKDVEMLFPRLIKHMVIKGKHCQRMYDMWKEWRSKDLSEVEIEQLKIFAKASRADAGSVKHKKHPTWAWVAGYLDGDGSFIFKQPPSQNNPRLAVQATAHENDKIALELLFKAFGGTLNNRGIKAPHIWDWKHSLGAKNTSFATKFLPKVLTHIKFKKHKIEQMLAYIHSRSTRTD